MADNAYDDSAAGIGPGLKAGFGRRSTANSSQTTTPSNPSPADSHGAKRFNFGPEKTKDTGVKKQSKTKPVKNKPKPRPRNKTKNRK